MEMLPFADIPYCRDIPYIHLDTVSLYICAVVYSSQRILTMVHYLLLYNKLDQEVK